MGHAKTVNVWKCDNCGKEEPWGKNWRSRMILHKSGGPGPWDEELVACSEDCAKSIDEKRKWKKLPDKSKGEPAIEIHGGKLQAAPNTRGKLVASLAVLRMNFPGIKLQPVGTLPEPKRKSK